MKQIKKIIDVPTEVNVHIEGSLVKIKGPHGENSRIFKLIGMNLEHSNNQLILSTAKTTRNFKKNLNSIAAHLKNMIKGVLEIYVYKLKICSGHFPMNVAIDKNEIVVKNFLGEKIPRRALILPGVSQARQRHHYPGIIRQGKSRANSCKYRIINKNYR